VKNPTVETQTDLETVFSKYQQLPVLRAEFEAVVEDLDDEPGKKFLVDMLVQIYLHRQADPTTMVGVLSPKYGTPQEVADLLMAAAEADYIDYDGDKKRFSVIFDITDDIVAMLDRYQYPLPMVYKPNEVTDNRSTGYETITNSVVLNGSKYFDDKDMCLDHLNRANSVALTLDLSVIKSAEGKFLIPKRKIGEDFDEHRKRLRQANIFYDTSVEVMEGLLEVSDELFMTHRFDRRGRCYSSGYHVNPQGTDFNKAVLQLGKKELVK
jgi:hypothetical protein